MIITMSPNIEGYKIVEYCGTVIAFVPLGLPFANDGDLIRARYNIENKLIVQAEGFNADAVISLSFNSDNGAAKGYLLATGTAVKIEKL